MEISTENYETMAFLGQDPVRCKVILDKKCLQQVKNFKYMGCEISQENEKSYSKQTRKISSNIVEFIQHFLKLLWSKNLQE